MLTVLGVCGGYVLGFMVTWLCLVILGDGTDGVTADKVKKMRPALTLIWPVVLPLLVAFFFIVLVVGTLFGVYLHVLHPIPASIKYTFRLLFPEKKVVESPVLSSDSYRDPPREVR